MSAETVIIGLVSLLLIAAVCCISGRLYHHLPLEVRTRIEFWAEKAVELYLMMVIALWLLIVFLPILLILTLL
ncbi:MAG: hypothetical protein MJ051_07390 [Akkermansia sp.]|nr:hypothetical protein [Akkermansia sp.]